MTEPIRLLDGPGVDAAAAKLRKAGLEVRIMQPTKALQLWCWIDTTISWAERKGEALPIEPFLELDLEVRQKWRKLTDAMGRKVVIDPAIVELMDEGLDIEAPVRNYYGIPSLAREPGVGFVLTLGTGGFEQDSRRELPKEWQQVEVSDRFAAAWIAEFEGGDG